MEGFDKRKKEYIQWKNYKIILPIEANLPKIMKRVLTKEWFSENEYEETLKHLNNII